MEEISIMVGSDGGICDHGQEHFSCKETGTSWTAGQGSTEYGRSFEVYKGNNFVQNFIFIVFSMSLQYEQIFTISNNDVTYIVSVVIKQKGYCPAVETS